MSEWTHYREYWRSRKTFILIGLAVLIIFFLSNGRLKDSSSELKELLVGNSMSNPLLIKHIQSVMRPPSGKEPILEKPDDVKSAMGQTGQVQAILDHFKNKRNGFFIEAGAWDGEQLSNTLYLETELGWEGLLVEPNKPIYDILVGKQRNAYSINSCLATDKHAQRVKFDTADVYGAIDDDNDPENSRWKQIKTAWAPSYLHKEIERETVLTQCFPIFSILLSLGLPRVDFFSLDIEGAEMAVLKTIPFDKVDIEVFLIETDKTNVTQMTAFMSSVGYEMTPMPPYDHLFIKKY